MLFETEGEELRTVATDGHRLAVCSMPVGQPLPSHSVIVPRKGVIELMRMLDGGDNPLGHKRGSLLNKPMWTFTSRTSQSGPGRVGVVHANQLTQVGR